jgi:D-threo-aldose 1-dehydrogenase
MTANPLETAEIGTTGLRVTRLGLGGAPIGEQIPEGGDDRAAAVVRRGYELGVRYFDTAPIYGAGDSERRYGLVLPDLPRDAFVLSTKVGRTRELDGAGGRKDTFDYSRDRVLRSLEDSLQRLRLDRIDIALIHDPDDHYDQAMNEAFPTLAELRSQGVVKAIGAGMNQWQMPARLARDGDFDCFLLAGRYTLLDQSGLAELLPLCIEKRISIVLGGPYNSGVLASDLPPGATFDYNTVSPDMLDRARRARSVCDRHGVPLKAAALQFGLAHPAVAATIPGARSIAEVEENVRMAAHPIPEALWDDLRTEGLIPAEAPTR